MNARFRFVLLTMATLLAIGCTTSLGFWQLSRASEKQTRQSVLDLQSSIAPVSAAEVSSASAPLSLLHRRARLRGTWQPSSLVFLENRPMGGRVGFLVMMPFVLEGGQGAIVVQRGWVPRGFDDRTRLPSVQTPDGLVEIEGRVALPPSDLYALGESSKGVIRQNMDLRQWSHETGLALMPISVQQTGANSEGLVRDWPVPNIGIEKNYGYAFQWFGMATLFVVLYVWFQVIRRMKFRPKDPSSHV